MYKLIQYPYKIVYWKSFMNIWVAQKLHDYFIKSKLEVYRILWVKLLRNVSRRNVNSGANFDQIAAMSRTFRPNNTRIVKCQNCIIQHPVHKYLAFGKACFYFGKLNCYAEFCKRQSRQHSILDWLNCRSLIQSYATIIFLNLP